MSKAVIRLHAYNPFIITTQEYEQIERDLTARALCGEVTLGDKIVYRLLQEHRSRYFEAKEQNEYRADVAERQTPPT